MVLFAARKEKNRSNLFRTIRVQSRDLDADDLGAIDRGAAAGIVVLDEGRLHFPRCLSDFLFYFGRIFPLGQRISRIDYIAHFSFTILFSFLIGFTNFLVQGLRQEDWELQLIFLQQDGFYMPYVFSHIFFLHIFYLFTKYLRTQGLLKNN